MNALTWHGKHDMRCESVPDPKIEHPRDAIIKVRACAINTATLEEGPGLYKTFNDKEDGCIEVVLKP